MYVLSIIMKKIIYIFLGTISHLSLMKIFCQKTYVKWRLQTKKKKLKFYHRWTWRWLEGLLPAPTAWHTWFLQFSRAVLDILSVKCADRDCRSVLCVWPPSKKQEIISWKRWLTIWNCLVSSATADALTWAVSLKSIAMNWNVR